MSEPSSTPKKSLPVWLIVLSFPISIPLVCICMVAVGISITLLMTLSIPALLIFDLCGRRDIAERIAPERWFPL